MIESSTIIHPSEIYNEWISLVLKMSNKTVLLSPSLTPIASVMWVSFIYLSRRLYPFPDAEIDNGKDEEKTKGQLPADRAQLVQTWGEVDV